MNNTVLSAAGSLALFVLVGCAQSSGESAQPTPATANREWTFVYYMSYDNDLATNSPIILDSLEKSVKGNSIAVTVLVDDQETNGLKRYAITRDRRVMSKLNTDDSASVEVVSDYLEWVRKTYPARHYAVVFLDHGGRLDEMCMDEQSDGKTERKWLSASLVGPTLREFRQKVSPGDVELLFLQQCGRGTIENLYNFRGAAAAIMTSQLGVGTPNTYYLPTLQWLASRTNTTGRELARQIMTTDEHFNNYVCVDGKALEELPTRLEPVVTALLGDRKAAPKPPVGAILCYEFDKETNYDLMSWLNRAFHENNRTMEPMNTFRDWVYEKLILEYAVQPLQKKELKDLCGLTLFVPEAAEVRGTYPEYPFYQAGHLASLWQAMYPPRDASRPPR